MNEESDTAISFKNYFTKEWIGFWIVLILVVCLGLFIALYFAKDSNTTTVTVMTPPDTVTVMSSSATQSPAMSSPTETDPVTGLPYCPRPVGYDGACAFRK